jgi:NADH-quinone oxidoreductase subunit M
VLAVVFCIAALSSLGLPGLNSFVGEFLALLGAFRANITFGVLGTLVVIPAAWYLLRFFQGVMEGPTPQSESGGAGRVRTTVARDLNGLDLAVLVPLLALMVLIGFFPGILPERIEPSVTGSVLLGQHPSQTTPPPLNVTSH